MAAKQPKEKVVYTKPTSQVDLEARLERDNESPLALVTATQTNPFGDEAYVNVDPIYQNYADDTHKPLEAEDGADKLAEKAFKDAVTVQEPNEDRSSDQKRSGAYVDSSNTSSQGSGAQAGDAPFGDSSKDSSDKSASDAGVATGKGE